MFEGLSVTLPSLGHGPPEGWQICFVADLADNQECRRNFVSQCLGHSFWGPGLVCILVAMFVYIGGTVNPPRAQQGGDYVADIDLDVYYTGN